ncbi:hypothetical protein BDZ89DRAFT_1052657 [Hymenopellis radicata]|nr:hypothetical protein BDZ89DRAFT_1052657 [Hymenopellis radicata]
MKLNTAKGGKKMPKGDLSPSVPIHIPCKKQNNLDDVCGTEEADSNGAGFCAQLSIFPPAEHTHTYPTRPPTWCPTCRRSQAFPLMACEKVSKGIFLAQAESQCLMAGDGSSTRAKVYGVIELGDVLTSSLGGGSVLIQAWNGQKNLPSTNSGLGGKEVVSIMLPKAKPKTGRSTMSQLIKYAGSDSDVSMPLPREVEQKNQDALDVGGDIELDNEHEPNEGNGDTEQA